ncbi:MAG: protein translocase subunit SecD [Nitrospirae bacterium]|nr:protein translocase subunit SecD [Candidatus Manganitrophaceae bacterium]
MKKSIKGRLLTLIALLVIAIFFLLPSTSIYSKLPAWWGDVFPSKGVSLGLDLKGGMHLVLEVEVEKAVDNAIERMASTLKGALERKEVEGLSIKVTDRLIYLSFPSDKTEVVKETLDEEFPNLVTEEESGGEKVLAFREAEKNRILTTSTLQALETIRNRVDEFGVAEPLIQKQGDKQILVQLPGIDDPERAMELIGKTALLEFKLLNENSPLLRDFPGRIEEGKEQEFLDLFKDRLDENDEILFERMTNTETGEVTKSPHIVTKTAALAGDLLSDARVSIGEFNAPYVSITFDNEGATLFEQITQKNVQRRLAIVLDGNIYSSPRIQEKISGGRAQISGTFTHQEASDLAIILRAGALPAPVKVLQNVTVGPSLGSDSIRKGWISGFISMLLVIAFMVIYYRFSGLLAVTAMAINIILLVGALATLNATLTLPGIAGIILSIGMAVDANVLILERIREELRAGRPVRMAIDAGYEKAFTSIFDSNVTTLITAIALITFGTGPIRGFAVTLGLGIAINLFTALVATKVVYDYLNGRKRLETLSI